MIDEITKNQIWRSIDANFNRSREALRVVEDCFRFSLNDQFLSKKTKLIRHELQEILNSVSESGLVTCRDTHRDVGRNTQATTEYVRTGIDDLIAANLQRAQQSVRSLEEFAKTLDADLAKSIEQIRYDLYSLEQAALATCNGIERLATTYLYSLIDECQNGEHFEQSVSRLIEGGVDAIQLRCKQLEDHQFLDRAKRLVELAKPRDVLAIINDRPDIAAIVSADGVHLGQEDMPVHDARQVLRPSQLVGVSTHNLQQVQKAVVDGANYIGLGPVFPSTTKSFDEFTGAAFLSEAIEQVAVPAFAIGGIDRSNVQQVVDAGCKRIAVQSALWSESTVDIAAAEDLRQPLVAATAACDR